ncbi:MAG: ankyrin repeat domain-containing protein [Acidimicrobiales bacterium]
MPHGDPVTIEVILAIHNGDLDALRRLVAERPEMATARMTGRNGVEGGWRTPLHAAVDWPGQFPNAPAAVACLLEGGADPNDHTGVERPESPLHWAASTDDGDVVVELVSGGADLETPGGSISNPLDNAIRHGCWHAARLLVKRGAQVDRLWHAALGMVARLDELMADTPDPEEISKAFRHACSGAQRRTAEYLPAHGADLIWVPDYAEEAPLDAASGSGTRRENVITWLRELGALSSASNTEPGRRSG